MSLLQLRLNRWIPFPPKTAGTVQEEITRTKVNFPRIAIPVRSIAAILLAIIGQGLLEPPKPLLGAALALYLAAIALLIWSAVSNEWTVSDNEEQPKAEWSVFKMRWQFLLAGSLLAGLAYIAFNGYVFSFLNLTLWIASLLCFLLGFLDLDPIKTGCWNLYPKDKSRSLADTPDLGVDTCPLYIGPHCHFSNLPIEYGSS